MKCRFVFATGMPVKTDESKLDSVGCTPAFAAALHPALFCRKGAAGQAAGIAENRVQTYLAERQ